MASTVFEGSLLNTFQPFRSVPLNLDQATISSNNGPKYDQAYLNELKANTPSSRPSTTTEPVSVSSELDPSIQVIDVDMGMSPSCDIDKVVEDSATVIHSESIIKSAKDRRERLRKTGTSNEEDFISLSVTKREDVDAGPHPESRLAREEDELGEGDDGTSVRYTNHLLSNDKIFMQSSRNTQVLRNVLRLARKPEKRQQLIVVQRCKN